LTYFSSIDLVYFHLHLHFHPLSDLKISFPPSDSFLLSSIFRCVMRIYTSPSPPLSYLPPNSLLLASTPVSPLPTAQILPSLKAQETFQKVQKRIPAIYAHHYSTIKHIEPTSQLKTLPEVADKYRKLKKSMLVRRLASSRSPPTHAHALLFVANAKSTSPQMLFLVQHTALCDLFPSFRPRLNQIKQPAIDECK